MQNVAEQTAAILTVEEDAGEALALAARTEPSAFAELYVRHRAQVYAYLRAGTTPDDAADLTALTFERGFAAIGRYERRDGGFRAWIFRIARNLAIDQRRRASQRPHLPVAGTAPSAEDEVVVAETYRELVEHLAGLVADQRDAVALRYAAGLTAREIGAVMGKSEAAAQKLVSRGLAALKEAYGVS